MERLRQVQVPSALKGRPVTFPGAGGAGTRQNDARTQPQELLREALWKSIKQQNKPEATGKGDGAVADGKGPERWRRGGKEERTRQE